MRATSWLLGLLLGGALTVGAVAAELPAAVGSEVALGKNLTDDSCRIRRTEIKGFGDDARNYQIYCDGWERSSGRVLRLVDDNRRNAAYLIEQSEWAKNILADATCEAPAPAPLIDGLDVLLRRCVHSSGWRRLMVVAESGKYHFLADFLPTNAPLIARAILASAGKRPLDQAATEGTRMASIRAVEELLGSSEKLASTADIGAIQAAYSLAYQQQAARLYRKSELSYRCVLDLQERVYGRNSIAQVRALHHLAEVVRNQRRFDAADATVERAKALMGTAADPGDIADDFVQRAYGATARGDYPAALKFAQQAVNAIASNEKADVQSAASAYYALGSASFRTTGPAAAEAPLRKAMQLHLQAEGPNSVWANRDRILLGRVLVAANKLADAKSVIDDALAMSERLYGQTI